MSTIPKGTKFRGVAPDVSTSERRSSILNDSVGVYTLDDFGSSISAQEFYVFSPTYITNLDSTPVELTTTNGVNESYCGEMFGPKEGTLSRFNIKQAGVYEVTGIFSFRPQLSSGGTVVPLTFKIGFTGGLNYGTILSGMDESTIAIQRNSSNAPLYNAVVNFIISVPQDKVGRDFIPSIFLEQHSLTTINSFQLMVVSYRVKGVYTLYF